VKVEYDNAADTLTLVLREGSVAESDEQKPGVILDYDDAGELLSIEVLDASRYVEEARRVTFSTVGQQGGVSCRTPGRGRRT
jgi:uncharacterized protein YuzE